MKKPSVVVHDVLIGLIDRPATPDRLSIDPEYIKELAASISEVGLLQPILLRPRDGRYEIIAGDCRYQAFLSLGRDTIPAVYKDLTEGDVSISRATENLQRQDLSVIEEARIYANLHNNHGMSWDAIAKRTGKKAGMIKRRYDLLKLPEILITAIHQKRIGFATAEELARLRDLGRIEYYLDFAVDHGATKEVVIGWVKEELALMRQKASPGGEGEWGFPDQEKLPIFVACDFCRGPMEIKNVRYKRICASCDETIKKNL